MKYLKRSDSCLGVMMRPLKKEFFLGNLTIWQIIQNSWQFIPLLFYHWTVLVFSLPVLSREIRDLIFLIFLSLKLNMESCLRGGEGVREGGSWVFIKICKLFNDHREPSAARQSQRCSPVGVSASVLPVWVTPLSQSRPQSPGYNRYLHHLHQWYH